MANRNRITHFRQRRSTLVKDNQYCFNILTIIIIIPLIIIHHHSSSFIIAIIANPASAGPFAREYVNECLSYKLPSGAFRISRLFHHESLADFPFARLLSVASSTCAIIAGVNRLVSARRAFIRHDVGRAVGRRQQRRLVGFLQAGRCKLLRFCVYFSALVLILKIVFFARNVKAGASFGSGTNHVCIRTSSSVRFYFSKRTTCKQSIKPINQRT